MDPLNVGGFLASIIGAVFSYRAEKQKEDEISFDGFLMSLDARRYKNLRDEIASNHLLGQGIKILLEDNHSEHETKLAVIESAIAAVSGQISGLKEVSDALGQQYVLSDQALSILKQLSESGESTILEKNYHGGTRYQILGASVNVVIKEPRFVDDDLDQLSQFGLLKPDFNGSGNRLFRITRAAVKLVEVGDL